MSELDEAKERLAYKKFWLGVVIAIFVSVGGWFVTNLDSERHFLLIASIFIEIIMIISIYWLNNRIIKLIKHIKKL
ncbi:MULTISPECIES: hypothetical protein [Pasteurellaceae]|uniref:Hemophilus-specific protein n=1 Tax=Pasteurella atlantica TaxID=2827233 RepID=A0AAW8CM48_9PAST|nr:hypothetical protein [Pasteurella atlantica]MBR0573849.1 hypothetical protein [Pasteurella atlantica]MDP8039241.1 hypothetical protein [Pasteurella atlantica]MDP8041332.1 hypothetical protein [Pasteurella atlantica]MDP8043468.1 hypothetical protein [Pasteurella atlantica]MDP8045613.1 hypothetical protein [Pasteurella atlantica]